MTQAQDYEVNGPSSSLPANEEPFQSRTKSLGSKARSATMPLVAQKNATSKSGGRL